MKVKGSKKGGGNGPKRLKSKGVKKPNGRFRTGIKKAKATLKPDNTTPERKKEKDTKKNASFKGGKKNSDNAAFKKEFKQNKSKGKKTENDTELPVSDQKRKAEDDSGQIKKKLRVKKEDEVQTRLDRKELKVARRKRKHNYELTVSLIKKYDGLRR